MVEPKRKRDDDEEEEVEVPLEEEEAADAGPSEPPAPVGELVGDTVHTSTL